MARTFSWDRFDVREPGVSLSHSTCQQYYAADGLYVLAQDAIDREAVLQAQIRTLETQLKDLRRVTRGT